MIGGVRYVHTNLVALDWRGLAAFYESVFGCVPVPPERDYTASDVERGTAVPGASIQGIHLRLPGVGREGPTLEIFAYSRYAPRPDVVLNRPGFGHIAFSVSSVEAARDEVLAHGGRGVGDTVTLTVANGDQVTWCYVTDPEGNVIELQSWQDRLV